MPVLDVETLLAHEAFVRRITRALVRDEHEADDVVQATFLAALERPPRTGTNVRGWLAGVARNIARRARRSHEREARRRARARPPAATPTPADAAEQRDIEHTVMAAVLALAEPYRRAILSRYHDGLSAKECAARLGVAPATVKTRLKRALATLRARLDHKHGGRAAWTVVLAAGLVPTKATAAATIGVLIMGKLATIGTALAVLLVALLAWWSSTPEREPRSVETASEDGGTEPPPAVQGGSESESPESEEDGQPLAGENGEASAAGRSRVPQVGPPEPGPRRIIGRVVDARGRGVLGVQMMAYRDGKRQRITTTEHNGWFALDGLDGDYQIFVLRGVQTAPAYSQFAELPGTFHTGGGSDALRLPGPSRTPSRHRRRACQPRGRPRAPLRRGRLARGRRPDGDRTLRVLRD